MLEIVYPEVETKPEFKTRRSGSGAMEVSLLVKVIPLGTGWCVAIGRGHSAEPISKELAIMRACVLARSLGEVEIGVYDSLGRASFVASSRE